MTTDTDRILQAGNGGIDQVELFKEAEDFDKMWDAVKSLKLEGLIHAQEGQLLPVS